MLLPPSDYYVNFIVSFNLLSCNVYLLHYRLILSLSLWNVKLVSLCVVFSQSGDATFTVEWWNYEVK